MNARRRFLSLTMAAFVMSGLVGCREFEESPALKAEHLVDSAVATVERFQTIEGLQRFSKYLPDAVAVAVFPSVIKAGFFIGGEGGNGVLTVKRPDGSWSAPAFYTMGAGSFGLQFGAQDTEIILVIRNQGALDAILKDQAKIGADAGVTVSMCWPLPMPRSAAMSGPVSRARLLRGVRTLTRRFTGAAKRPAILSPTRMYVWRAPTGFRRC